MTSSTVLNLKDGDSSRSLRGPRCRFAVRRPGSTEASPRSHGMPCRGLTRASLAAMGMTGMPRGAGSWRDMARGLVATAIRNAGPALPAASGAPAAS